MKERGRNDKRRMAGLSPKTRRGRQGLCRSSPPRRLTGMAWTLLLGWCCTVCHYGRAGVYRRGVSPFGGIEGWVKAVFLVVMYLQKHPSFECVAGRPRVHPRLNKGLRAS